MPKAVKSKDGTLNMFPTPLDPERCWLMIRPRKKYPGEEEIILTPAALSSDPTDEDHLADFLHRFGWKVILQIDDGRTTSTGRPEHFWFSPPGSLKDPKQVLKAIQDGLKECRGGPEQLEILEKKIRDKKLHLVTSLEEA